MNIRILLQIFIISLVFGSCSNPTKENAQKVNPSKTNRQEIIRTVSFYDTIHISKNFKAEIIEKETHILNYIENLGNYVAITEYEKLPNLIKQNYSAIVYFCYQNNLDKNNFYIDTSNIRELNLVIGIPISHYSGFKKSFQAEQNNTFILGNASGKDGLLEINKLNGRIIAFTYWI